MKSWPETQVTAKLQFQDIIGAWNVLELIIDTDTIYLMLSDTKKA